MFPSSHKTIMVLDHTPYFGISSDIQIDLGNTRIRYGMIPLAPIKKPLWTCGVEASLDYTRIVWDIFPKGKLIRFVVSDNQARHLNTWATSQQNIDFLHDSFRRCGRPPKLHANSIASDYSIVHGLRSATEAMCEYSEEQHAYRSSHDASIQIINRCRIVCITSARDDDSIKNLEDIFLNDLTRTNKIASTSEHLLSIHHCHLVIINAYPRLLQTGVTGHAPNQVTPFLTTEVHSVRAGRSLYTKMLDLVLAHYDLASSTITGIPMKEEQNANSSANYDVEIFHPAAAHDSLSRGDYGKLIPYKSRRDSLPYETINLRWNTPRNLSSNDGYVCTSLHCATLVNVNSRQSVCLTTFLLNGRTVILEVAKRNGQRAVTHMLTGYGGIIYIQNVYPIRQKKLPEAPKYRYNSNDYRVNDFKLLVKSSMLYNMKRRYLIEKEVRADAMAPIDRSILRLEKLTRFYPLTYSSTIIFNIKKHTEPLLSLMLKDKLSSEELLQCRQCIYNLISLEARHEPLNLRIRPSRRRAPKREEQFKLLWSELEAYVRAYNNSARHKEVLTCLIECRRKPDAAIRQDKLEVEKALRSLEQCDAVELSFVSKNYSKQRIVRPTTDSPMSPPLHGSSHKSFLNIWLEKQNKKNPATRQILLKKGTTAHKRLYEEFHEDDKPPHKINVETYT